MSDSKKPTKSENVQKFKVVDLKPKPKEEDPVVDENANTIEFLSKLLEMVKADKMTQGIVVFANLKTENGFQVVTLGGGYMPVAETMLALDEFKLANLVRRI